jgi:branched-chain amino acid transport system permease protein
VLVAVALNYSDQTPRPLPARIGGGGVHVILGARVRTIDLYVICCAVCLSLLVMALVQYSQFGRALRAVAFSPDRAEIVGINSQAIVALTMGISGALAGVAAALSGADNLVYNQDLGNTYILKGFAIVVLGGAGSIAGTILGSLVLGFAEILTATYVSSSWANAIAFGLILVILLLRPQGLIGLIRGPERV